MRKAKKLTRAGLAAAAIACLLTVPVSAVIPYSSYTYDSYGNAVDTSDLYEPETVLTGDLILRDNNDVKIKAIVQPTDMFVTDDGHVYILDQGNGRLVVLKDDLTLDRVIDTFTKDGEPQELTKASGVYVDDEEHIYIADTGNNRVLCTDRDGKVFREILKPDSEFFSDTVEFIPTKLMMDSAGNLYVQCTGIYQGLVIFDKQYNYKGFFGADEVQTTSEALKDFFWKRFMTEAQREEMANYVPPEIQNFHITDKDFVYTVTPSQRVPFQTTKIKMDSIRYLNPKGTDRLVNKMSKKAYNAMETDARDLNFTDVVYDEKGFLNVVDNLHGKIYQFDSRMNLITAFGALGSYEGTFSLPVAIEMLGDRILVLDQNKCSVTVFRLTETGREVHDALELYNAGKYSEAIEPWKRVIEKNTNFELAYIGVGNALYNQQDYKGAMEYFKLGRDSEKYSEAFKEYRVELLRHNMQWVMLTIVLLFVLYVVIKKRDRIFKKKTGRKG